MKQNPQQPLRDGKDKDKPHIQGEGDYEAARRFNQSSKSFVQSGRVDEAADAAEPRDAAQREQMERAEQAGKARAKEEDPQISRRR